MVFIVVQGRREDDQFLVETNCEISLDELIAQLVQIHNLRVKIEKITNVMEQMASDQVEENKEGEENDDGHGIINNNNNNDNTIGAKLSKEFVGMFDKTISEARVFLSKSQVLNKVCMTVPSVAQELEVVKAAFTIAFSAKSANDNNNRNQVVALPSTHIVNRILQFGQDNNYSIHSNNNSNNNDSNNSFPNVNDIDNENSSAAYFREFMDPATATAWWANKELRREEKLSKFIGKNEKTKIIVKLQKKGQGPPPRSAESESAQQKEMLAYYYKKAQEQKRLEEEEKDEDASVYNAPWANSKSLKNSFTGMSSNISWKPM